MAISNISSGLRSGVCTSTTRPQAPFEGQLIYETDTNRVLIWDNAAWVMIADTDQPPAVNLVADATFVNQPFVEVTGFSSDYEWYEISFSAVRATSGNTAVLGVLYNGATARNSSYYGGNGGISRTGTFSAEYNMDNAGDFYGTAIESRYRGNFNMRVFFKAGEQFTYNINGFNGYTFNTFFGGGFRASTEPWDRIRFTGFSGNMTGQWALYGYRI